MIESLTKRKSTKDCQESGVGVNFINILRAQFLYEILLPKNTKLYCTEILYENCARIMLMKLTTEVRRV